ncbi:separase isoform X2 [Amborella trichopoda]|uniref:separase isoform X2 n=1 Tax=Amborella trichopoda TaxID=13333 RepID=UPI0009C01BA5|nr:separase isoform X2 [Amborella trichopoda]|eukprot:XP_020517182.1 separase isoform X2 [Amborella trichopoda]
MEQLISTLHQTSNCAGLSDRFYEYLKPLLSLSESNPSHLRPLAKCFVSSLSRLLKVLPETLKTCPSPITCETLAWSKELFKIYEMTITCISRILPCLDWKPYGLDQQRLLLARRRQIWGYYNEAKVLCYQVLEGLQPGVTRDLCRDEVGACLLPDEVEKHESGLASLIVETVFCIVNCMYESKCVDSAAYRQILSLINLVRPWLRVLTFANMEKLHGALLHALYKCTLFIVKENTNFEGDLVDCFSKLILAEYQQSPMNDLFPKIATGLMASFGSKWTSKPSLFLDILSCTLESLICNCKLHVSCHADDILQFVNYFVGNCQNASSDIQKGAVKLLIEVANKSIQVSRHTYAVLSIYGAGLYFLDRDVLARKSGLVSETRKIRAGIPLDGEETLGYLPGSVTLELLPVFVLELVSFIQRDETWEKTFPNLEGGQTSFSCGSLGLRSDGDRSCTHLHGEISSLSFLNALESLCKPFVEFVRVEWECLPLENKGMPCYVSIDVVLYALHLFCVGFSIGSSHLLEQDMEKLHKSLPTFLLVIVAYLKLSLMTLESPQRHVDCIDHILSRGWVRPQDLKFLISSLYNIVVSLYNMKQMKKASFVLKLCHKAAWARVSLLCQKYTRKPVGTHSDFVSRELIVDSVSDACSKSAFFLNVLHQCGDSAVKETFVDCLSKWSVADTMITRLAEPFDLVRQWVKELLAYAEMEVRYSSFCLKMQQKIISILLGDIYVTENNYLLRSKILLLKSRVAKASGLGGLNDCLQCLSESICLLNTKLAEDPAECNASLCHQLAMTYCLHALCTQEADQNSEVIHHDVSSALNLWAQIYVLGSSILDSHHELGMQNALPLLYHTVDLLSLKDFSKLSLKFHELILQSLCTRKKIPLGECLAVFWGDRRLNHALCTAPIDDAFIAFLSKEFEVSADSFNFWVSCIKGNPYLLLGFQQKFLLVDSIVRDTATNPSKECPLGTDISYEKIIEAASNLVSNVAKDTRSIFIAGYLYYDLSERLVSSGKFLEALSYARKSLNLRKKLLQRNFLFSSKSSKTEDIGDEEINVNDKAARFSLEILGSKTRNFWPEFVSCGKFDDSISPWNVLRTYLESALQVGRIYEAIGCSDEAEHILSVGKEISCSQGFILFGVTFGSILGELYFRKQLWDQSEKELVNAKQKLDDSKLPFACTLCKLTTYSILEMRIGNLIQNYHARVRDVPLKQISGSALDIYTSAQNKLCHAELEYSFCLREKSSSGIISDKNVAVNEPGREVAKMSRAVPRNSTFDEDVTFPIDTNSRKAMRSTKRANGFKNASTDAVIACKQQGPVRTSSTTRRTRSSSRKASNQEDDGNEQMPNVYSNPNHVNLCPHIHSLRETKKSLGCICSPESKCDGGCLCDQTCWICHVAKVCAAGSMKNFVALKWSFHHRSIFSRLHLKIGKCLRLNGKIHEVHDRFHHSLSFLFLVNRLSSFQTHSSGTLFQFDYVEKQIPGDIFPIERALLLYEISCLTLRYCFSMHSRTWCCVPRIVGWLLQAFVGCRELPLLFGKVSRLLAMIHLLSTSVGLYSLPVHYGKKLSAIHWAAYFHQASLGSSLNLQHLAVLKEKIVSYNDNTLEGLHISSSTERIRKACDFLRFAPEKLDLLEGFIVKFFEDLPSFTCICISFIGSDYASFLGELSDVSSQAWMLLSRLNLMRQPVVLLLPVDSVLEDVQQDNWTTSVGTISNNNGSSKEWSCPWNRNVLDDVAAQFRVILEENFLSSSTLFSVDTNENRSIWWNWRTKLNDRLGTLLRSVEDSWFGPWSFLLLGELFDDTCLNAIQKKLAADLKRMYKLELDASLLRALISSVKSIPGLEACVSHLLSSKGWFGSGCSMKQRNRASANGECQLILKAARDLEIQWETSTSGSINREPIALVLDDDLVMLPWESIPILRKQEVYRMPSLGSISALSLLSSGHDRPQVRWDQDNLDCAGGCDGADVGSLPSVDPLDAYYLLNPSGDLHHTQSTFEDWFRNQKWEGKAGIIPTVDELVSALKNHDLFLYFGHGSGEQYIPGHNIQSLDHCAATLLMGCSSGCLYYKGCYAPKGAPLYYLIGGCPVVIANLWEVTDKDIDRFSQSLLDSWLKVEPSLPVESTKSDSLVEEFKSMKIIGRGIAKSSKSKRKAQLGKDVDGDPPFKCRDNDFRIASFISQARDTCRLSFLNGASPVCYGVPTLIKRKRV